MTSPGDQKRAEAELLKKQLRKLFDKEGARQFAIEVAEELVKFAEGSDHVTDELTQPPRFILFGGDDDDS